MNRKLVDVCLGRVKADLVLKCKTLLNVLSGEILDDVAVAIEDDRVAYVGKKADRMVGFGTEVLRIRDGVVVPGFIDAHTHIDMLCTPTEQAEMTLIHGTTTLFAEPDELTSVMGFEGLRLFINEVKRLPLKVYVIVPLTSPQDPKLCSVKAMPLNAYENALAWDNVVGLGETVAWTLVLNHDKYYMEKFKLALRKGKMIEGHTAGARDAKLAACVCSGISSCHESIDVEQALERLRLGIFLMIREGSLRRDMPSILPGLINLGVDLSNAAFVTDWVDPVDLTELGYMDHVIKRAVDCGLDPVKAIQMVTINSARHFRVDDLVGAIAPGRYADIVVLRSLRNAEVLLTISNGVVVARNGKFKGELTRPQYPKSAFKTMRVAWELKPVNFKINAPISEGKAKVLVAKLENEIVTRKEVDEVNIINGKVELGVDSNLAKIAVIDRHNESGRIEFGLIKGFGAKIGAIASSVNFDENQLVVIGYDDLDMAMAANETVRLGGGIVLFDKGKFLEALPLPIAGVMSYESLETVAAKLKKVNAILSEAGSTFSKPLNVLFFTTFVTLPEIRFTDKGIVDVKNRCYTTLFVR